MNTINKMNKINQNPQKLDSISMVLLFIYIVLNLNPTQLHMTHNAWYCKNKKKNETNELILHGVINPTPIIYGDKRLKCT